MGLITTVIQFTNWANVPLTKNIKKIRVKNYRQRLNQWMVALWEDAKQEDTARKLQEKADEHEERPYTPVIKIANIALKSH